MVMGVGGVIGALAPDSPRSLDPPRAADRGLPAGGRLIARNKKRIWLPVQHPSVNKLSLRFATNVWAVQPSTQPSIVFGLPSLHYDPRSLGCARISGPAFIAENSRGFKLRFLG